jgi:hypothetical protein
VLATVTPLFSWTKSSAVSGTGAPLGSVSGGRRP